MFCLVWKMPRWLAPRMSITAEEALLVAPRRQGRLEPGPEACGGRRPLLRAAAAATAAAAVLRRGADGRALLRWRARVGVRERGHPSGEDPWEAVRLVKQRIGGV